MHVSNMDGRGTADLLASCPVMMVSGKDQIADSLTRLYRVRGVEFERSDAPSLAVANRVQIGGVTLHYCHFAAGIRIDFAAIDGFRQFFRLKGSAALLAGGNRLSLDGATTGIIPPDHEMSAHYGDGYEQLVVQIDQQALLHKAELIKGREIGGVLTLPVLAPLAAGKLRALNSIAMALATQFSKGVTASSIVTSELSQALVSAFLTENAANFPASLSETPLLAGRNDAARLEDYIHANWNKALTVEDVAAACGVSVRSVFAQFKQQRGVTPMAYIRDLRLDHANRKLMAVEGPVSVIDIAMACGFASLGHFAQRYRQKFGELPSATVVRARSQRGAGL